MNRLFKEHHREDAERLHRVLVAAGHDVSVEGAEVAWMLHSDEEWAAGWMGMPESDADLLEAAIPYI
jgi:hypothetical protein